MISRTMTPVYKASLLSVLLFTMCQKHQEVFTSKLSMTIDGVRITCDRNIEASGNLTRGTSLSAQRLNISGGWTSDNTRSSVELELYNYQNTTGEWSFSSPSAAYLYYEKPNADGTIGSSTYVAQGANTKLTILEVDDKFIKGTFSFVATMNTGPGTNLTKTVTEGSFHIKRNP